MKQKLLAVTALGLFGAASLAQAEVGLGLRGGTMGYGVDLDIGLTERLNARLGYNFFSYDETIDDTDVSYDGELKINSFSALLDWHPFGGGFRLSLGAVTSGPKIEVVGTPTGGNYEIGDGEYSASEVGDLYGEVKIGNSVAPYVGLGYGNVARGNHRVTFLFDLGAVYGGDPEVTLTARCGASVPANRCAQLQNDVQAEITDLKNDTDALQWYPVVNLGIGIRF